MKMRKALCAVLCIAILAGIVVTQVVIGLAEPECTCEIVVHGSNCPLYECTCDAKYDHDAEHAEDCPLSGVSRELRECVCHVDVHAPGCPLYEEDTETYVITVDELEPEYAYEPEYAEAYAAEPAADITEASVVWDIEEPEAEEPESEPEPEAEPDVRVDETEMEESELTEPMDGQEADEGEAVSEPASAEEPEQGAEPETGEEPSRESEQGDVPAAEEEEPSQESEQSDVPAVEEESSEEPEQSDVPAVEEEPSEEPEQGDVPAVEEEPSEEPEQGDVPEINEEPSEEPELERADIQYYILEDDAGSLSFTGVTAPKGEALGAARIPSVTVNDGWRLTGFRIGGATYTAEELAEYVVEDSISVEVLLAPDVSAEDYVYEDVGYPEGWSFGGIKDIRGLRLAMQIKQLDPEFDTYMDEIIAVLAANDVISVNADPSNIADILAVYAVMTGNTDSFPYGITLQEEDDVALFRSVYWSMTQITGVSNSMGSVLKVSRPTAEDVKELFELTDDQAAQASALAAAFTTEVAQFLESVDGSNAQLVEVAISQLGNVGGVPYWSWYGFDGRVEWCACFVSWCANECGFIAADMIPQYAGCVSGVQWFKDRGQWAGRSVEPYPGMIIFFDWDGEGGQDGLADHTGIVERVENGYVYTVEGNSGDACRERSYPIGYYEILGYGLPDF